MEIKRSPEQKDAEPDPNGPISVEDVYEKLGGFSKFQIFVTAVIICVEIPGAMVSLSPILITTNKVDFYCETGNGSILLPKDKLCSYPCEGTISSKQPFKSIVQEWNLICDKAWISDTLTSLFMGGCALGPLLTAQIAERFGRKPAFFMVCTLFGISGILSSLVASITAYSVLKFVSGIAAGGVLVSHTNYLMEFLTPHWRVICGGLSLWPIGEMFLALVGYLSPEWRTLTWISVLPAIILMLAYPFMHESPRWLLCKNRTKDAGAVLDTIARWNKRPKLTPETLEQLQHSVLKDSKTSESSNRWTAFKNRKILFHMGILFLAWFSNALVYYGISFNMKNMSGNPYFNVFLMGVLDFPAELIAMPFSNRFGRKKSLIGFLIVSVLCVISVAGIQLYFDKANEDATLGVIILILCLAGRFFNETSYAVQTCFTAETFPTIIRTICFSICSIASSTGGILAPQMVFLGTLWVPGPYLFFCGICTISCIVCSRLEETKKQPLHDVN